MSGSGNIAGAPVVTLESVVHRFGKTVALADISLDVPSRKMIGLIGPDGVGKSTLMSLVAGAKIIQAGRIRVLGGDIGERRHRDTVCARIAFMPQGLGKNLYMQLSVFENLDFFGRLYGQSKQERRQRIDRLLAATGLTPFADRLVGQLSGGMKQKLGLCCALIHDPDLLLLDEPTTGVDPLSRQQFWKLIDDIRSQRPQMSVLVSTAYMDEANRFDQLIAMHAGKVLATGSPSQLKTQTRSDSLEAAFVSLLPESTDGRRASLHIPPRRTDANELAIRAEGLTRRFGSFVAVDNVSFEIERGEIFGFLGSNGCGKTTTMKMLTGLLPASEGHASLFGKAVEAGSLEVRRRVGYMSQSFSLYSELTVRQNLWLHARLFHLPRKLRRTRIEQLTEQFGLKPWLDQLAAQLPLGVRQRLSLAVAIIHRPEMLILDEPTSGVDPIARDQFWELLARLSREERVTIFISTHFMNEAERCDRISLMHAGKVLACDAPDKLADARGTGSLEQAFIAYIQAAEAPEAATSETDLPPSNLTPTSSTSSAPPTASLFRPQRALAYSHRESLEILRDPVRLGFAFIGSALLMLVFGFGITMDVNKIDFAVLDQDRSPESRDYIGALIGSNYFQQQTLLESQDDLERQLKENRISLGIEIPPNFGRELRRGTSPQISAWIDGSNPSRASTIEGYVQGVHASHLQELALQTGQSMARPMLSIEQRFRYNPTFESVYAMVPSVPAILLVLIPSILMAVSVVKEKELGSITNFYVTPTSRLEFLLGKQLPYIGMGLISFGVLTLMDVFLFDVPIKGSGLMLLACAVAYITAVTGIGLVISSFTSSQVAAVFVTTIVTILPSIQFSGLMQPVSTLEGVARWMGVFWPTTYYMHASVGAFTKGLTAPQLAGDFLALVAFFPVLTLLAAVALRKQEQ
ncbi:ribosome-associated ATPase/putative transporter RbbA [Aureliella helgolandensis]|uniref:Putative ABC transporter ATP-binding protein YbhF n=1 Tax=Aureliella helgolandensis TaxID=2527968 RepID=A0A518G879_9BACT|nr:ribosome-associated ATPase/putative transporter RbbA [Aureliella helgolandensis]QDV24791.1 putative ABC transporter ATP-binding protein YbhF [Aureliella helgolandensis]